MLNGLNAYRTKIHAKPSLGLAVVETEPSFDGLRGRQPLMETCVNTGVQEENTRGLDASLPSSVPSSPGSLAQRDRERGRTTLALTHRHMPPGKQLTAGNLPAWSIASVLRHTSNSSLPSLPPRSKHNRVDCVRNLGAHVRSKDCV